MQPLAQPALKLGVIFVLILSLKVQPTWLPLLEDLRLAGQSDTLTAEGLAALQDAYARQPWNPDRALSAGLAALAAGDYEAAKAALTVAAGHGGWTPELRVALGDAHFGAGEVDEAIEAWELALPSRLDDAALLTRLASAYESRGRYPEAAAALRSLVALEPQNAVARYRFGVMLSVIDPPAAPQHLALAAGLDDSVRPFAESLNRAVEAGLQANDQAYTFGIIGYTLIGLREYPLAKDALLRAVEERGDFADAYAYLGLAEDQLGNDGSYAYRRALELNPDLPLAHYLFGLHQRQAGQVEQAIASLNRAFELDPSNAAAAAELGGIYTAQADLPTAEEWYRQAVRIAPEDPAFWQLLAEFYINHDYKVDTDGLLSAEQAAKLAPDSALAVDTLGFAHYLNGQLTVAEDYLLKARELDPQRASTHFHLGLVYLDSNRSTQAKQSLEAAVGLDAGGPIAEKAFQALARLGITSLPTAAPIP